MFDSVTRASYNSFQKSISTCEVKPEIFPFLRGSTLNSAVRVSSDVEAKVLKRLLVLSNDPGCRGDCLELKGVFFIQK